MPTVHLSLPEKVYRQLKEKAAEMGIQVTDLIKFYITSGLRGGLPSAEGGEPDVLRELSERLDKLERRVSSQRVVLEGKYKEMEELVRYVIERLEMLEEIVESLPRASASVGVD
ncbi:MAG: hypothetical protein LRS49_00395 [Desulfurococcales archaeon]|nr:hypothetical protein [Desulfurococcales archaeon]